jgi:preprotein translocase subunit SecG
MGCAFLFVVILLGLTYLFSYKTYSQVTAELAQNALGLIPGKSRILYHLEMEFWTFLGASITILVILISLLFRGEPNNIGSMSGGPYDKAT